jgi:hypothetical protein
MLLSVRRCYPVSASCISCDRYPSGLYSRHRAEVLTSTPNMQIKTITAAVHHCVVHALARCRCLPQRRPRPSVLAGVCSASHCRHSMSPSAASTTLHLLLPRAIAHTAKLAAVPLQSLPRHAPVYNVSADLPSTMRAGTVAYCQSQSRSHPPAAHRHGFTVPVVMYKIHPQSHVRVHHLRTSSQLCGSCRTPAALSSCSFSPSSHSRETAHSCHPSFTLCSCSSSSHCCPLTTLAPVVAASDPSYHTATPTAWAHIASLRVHRDSIYSPSPDRH